MYKGPNPKSINQQFPDHSYDGIVCLINGEIKKKIEKGYLSKLGYTKESYQEKFPEAPMVCKSTLDKYKNPSDKVKLKRSETMRNLNYNDNFKEKRINAMREYWKSDISNDARNFYSEKAKKQHRDDNLSEHVRNYFKNDYVGSEHQKKLKEKMKNNNPWSKKEVRNKIEKNWLIQFGFDNPAKSNEIKEKVKNTHNMKYNGHFSQQHFSNEFKQIINSLENFNTYMQTKSPKTAASEFGVSITTIIKYGKTLGYNFIKDRSSYEIEIENWLKDNNINYIANTRNIISPMELDFYLPDYNLAIEFNGLYWHSDLFKEKNYHLNKYLACKEKGIRLIMIQEDEWINSSKLIKSKILNIVGKSEKGLPARKLFISEITANKANNFCEKFHIQGKTGQVIYSCGAFDDMFQLIGVMVFNKQRNTGDIELIRFCTDGKIHNGLFSKMLKFSIKENKFEKIISFADLRYSEGNLYERTNFKKISVIKPDYMYVVNGKRVHKSNYAKNSIIKKKLFSEEYVKNNTEKTLTEELDLCRIYDIGKIKYEMKIIM